MGKAIVYCRNCGASLREQDFAEGRGFKVGLNTFCKECAGPVPPVQAPPPTRETPKSGMPRSSTSRIPVLPRTTRRYHGDHDGASGEEGSKGKTLVILGGTGAVGLLLFIILAFSAGTQAPVRPPAPPAPAPVASAKPAQRAEPPKKSLPRKALAPADAYTVEKKMREELALAKTRQFDRNLAELRTMIEKSDPGTRTEEIDRMLDSLSMTAKGRHGDVVQLRALHEERLKTVAAPAAEAEPPAKVKSLPLELEGHWTLDAISDGRSEDISAYGRHALVKGTLEVVPGRIGKGIRFKGDDSYLELPRVEALNTLQEESYTLAAWFHPDDVPKAPENHNFAYSAVVIKTGMHLGLSYSYSGGGSFEMMQWYSGMLRAGGVAGTASPVNAWHHLVGVVDRGKEATTLYVDGRLMLQVPWPKGSRETEASYRRKPWYIGIGLPDAKNWGWSARGIVDDVRIYSRALSSQDVARLYGDTDRLAADPPGAVQTLFDGTDMGKWVASKGDWKVVDGTMAADVEDTTARAVHTKESFRQYRLTGEIWVKGRTYVEIHLHSYGVSWGGHLTSAGWSSLEIVVQDGKDAVSLDRSTIKRGVLNKSAESGWVGVFANGPIRIRNVELKLLE